MALTLAEGLVNAIKTYLDDNMAAKVGALNTEYGDGITLTATVATYKGIKSLKAIPNYPALFIISPSETIRPRAAHSAVEFEINAFVRIAVGILVIEQDSEKLQLRLYRYGRALIEMLMEAARDLNGWNLATDEDWSLDMESAPFSDGGQSAFVGEVAVEVRGSKLEWT